MKPLDSLGEAGTAGIRFVLMDIDDTLTLNGKLPACAFAALWELHNAGFALIPVTGRPAGWCDMIARQWPVDGVIGENGALVFYEERKQRHKGGGVEGVSGALNSVFHPRAVRNDHPVLVRVKERALAEVPGLRIARDQFARLFDLALDFAEEEPALPLEAARRVQKIAQEEGAQAKISSIHVNVWMGDYDKVSMAELFLRRRFGLEGEDVKTQVLFAGDSPNDEPMFARFPLSCAVSNIERYLSCIQYKPAFAASRPGGEGFAEIAALLLQKPGLTARGISSVKDAIRL